MVTGGAAGAAPLQVQPVAVVVSRCVSSLTSLSRSSLRIFAHVCLCSAHLVGNRKLPSPENLVRIRGLVHFSQDVNRTAGLGFVQRRRLITLAYVWKMIGRVSGLMIALFVVVHVVVTNL